VGGKLLVYMIAPDRDRVQCGFRFVAYAANLSYLTLQDGFEGDAHQAGLAIDASGYVNRFNPAGLDHAHGVQSVSWNAGLGRYEIDLDKPFGTSDRAIVTIRGDAGNCPGGATARDWHQPGLLYVQIADLDGNSIECSFTFIVKDW
jgi:hypothetical protein